MKAISITLIFFIIQSPIFSQIVPDRKPNVFKNGKKDGPWVDWYTEKWKKTEIIDSVFFYRKINFEEGIPVGKVYDYFKSGRLRWEGTLSAADPDVEEGKSLWYYENGNKEKEVPMNKGKIDGEALEFYESGKLFSKVNYNDGAMDGDVLVYYENGAVKVSGKHIYGKKYGKWYWYREDGTVEDKDEFTFTDLELIWENIRLKADNFSNAGDYGKAIACMKLCRNYAKDSLGIEHIYYFKSTFQVAGLYHKNKEFDDALPYYEEALKLSEKKWGGKSKEYTICLNSLTVLKEDISKNKKYLEAKAKNIPPQKPNLLRNDKREGEWVIWYNSEWKKTNSIDSVSYYRKISFKDGLPIGKANDYFASGKMQWEGQLLTYDPDVMVGKAFWYDENGKIEKEDDFSLVEAKWKMLKNETEAFETVKDFDQAITAAKKVVEFASSSFPTNDDHYIVSMGTLARLYQSNGQYEEALPIYTEMLRNAEISLGKNHPDYSISLNNLAQLYYVMGQYENALPLYLAGLENAEKSSNKNYAIFLDNLASLYKSLGQNEKALPLYIKAIRLAGSSGKDENYSVHLSNLGQLYMSIRQYEDALPLYLEAISILEKYDKSNVHYIICQGDLAQLYNYMGRNEEAVTIYLEVLQNAEKYYGKNRFYSSYINNLAIIYEDTGQYEKAMSLYLEAMIITEKNLGKDHPLYITRLNNLANLYDKLNQYEKAQPLYTEAINLVLKSIDKYFAVLSENEKIKYSQQEGTYFENYKNFCLRYSGTEKSLGGHAFDIELATKGMALNSGIEMRQTIANSNDENALKKYNDWKSVLNQLSTQYSLPVSGRRDDIKDLEIKANKLEGELSRISSSFKQVKSLLGTKWTNIQNKLQPNEVAIEFTSFNYCDANKCKDSTIYAALVLRKGDIAPVMVRLCEAKQLEALLQKDGTANDIFYSGLYENIGIINKKHAFPYGNRLYDLLWKPIDKLLAAGDVAYFAPSGLLHQIAFAAIPYSKDRLLSDRYKLIQLSSTAMLLRESPFMRKLPESLITFGGIQYDASEKDILAHENKTIGKRFVSRSLPEDLVRSGSWDYLDGTLKETQAIESLALKNKIKATSFYGLEASEAAYKSISSDKSPQVIHIASHGFFFPDPKIDRVKIQGDVTNGRQVFKYSDNPMNRSGLLFAGANNAWAGKAIPNVEDGILTAYEAANVNLNNTQLVVLSACETGLGDIKGSEGVFGLQRSFKIAGAEYVIMSLWKIPDLQTTELMTNFYANWFEGKSLPDAFIASQKYMKNKYPEDTYKWAAFVLVK